MSNENTKEIWKDVVGYEGLYQVSSLGRIKSLDRKIKCRNNYERIVVGKIKIPFKKKEGYLTIKLYKSNKLKSFYVHRLVAQAFIDNPHCKKTVNHINEIKTDNRIENLEWATYSENLSYNNLRERMSKTKKEKGVLVKENNPNWKDIEYYETTPVERGSFLKCCIKNKGWSLEEFTEVWKGDKNSIGAKKFYYIHKSRAFKENVVK